MAKFTWDHALDERQRIRPVRLVRWLLFLIRSRLHSPYKAANRIPIPLDALKPQP